MSTIDLRYRSSRRHLEALEQDASEEPWKIAYQEAEQCHSFGLTLSTMINVLEGISTTDRLWREAVYRAVEPPDVQMDERNQECFSRWLRVADAMLQTIARFERLGYPVDHAEEFRRCREKAAERLAKWVPPLPSASPAMHAESVSEEEADELRALLADPPGSLGKLKVKPLELPEGDSSLLR